MQRSDSETVTLNDILMTEELFQRSPRPANVQADHQVRQTLAQQMAENSKTLLQTLVDLAVEQCQAGTAGVSLLETSPTGEKVFCWITLAGTLAQSVGKIIPRDFSCCGVCLDRGTPQLFRYPERYFTDFQIAHTPIVEGLGVPLMANGQALGVLWIVSHDEGRQFDLEDLRIMTGLANLTTTALLVQHQNQELQRVHAVLEAEIAERQQMEERCRWQAALANALISNLPLGAAFVVDRDLRYLLAEGEALVAAGFKPEDFVGHTLFEVLSPDLVARYEPLYRQALAGQPFEHEHNAHDRTYISRGTPLRAEEGEIAAVLAVSYDVTERSRAEAERQQAATAMVADLEDMQRLRELSARLVAEDDIQAIYQEIVATAIALTRADAGTVQILDETTQDFLLLAAQGFEPEMIDGFYRVQAGSHTSCGIALARGDRAFIDFDTPNEDPDGNLRLHLEAGYFTAQSTPLISRSGKTIGMVSTHWRNHHRPSDRELHFLDLLARQAADLIEQRQAQIALRKSEEKYRLHLKEEVRKRTAELKETKDLLQTIFDTSPNSITTYKPVYQENQIDDFQIVFVNAFTEKTAGVNPTGLLLTQTFPTAKQNGFFDRLKNVTEQKQMQDFELCDEDEGLRRWFRIIAVPMEGMILVTTEDITERKQAQEEILRLKDEAAQKATDNYYTLFNTIDEGVSVLELIYDDSGKPVDMRWIEVNLAFEEITGLKHVAGRLTSEFVPTEDYWLEIYDRVVKTGKPIRYENYHAGIQQWYRTHTSRMGGPESRQVANVFEDITERKRRELNTAFLDEIGKDLSLLSAPDEIIQTVGARLGQFLGLSGCIFVDVDEAKNEATIHHGWNISGVPRLQQTFRLADDFAAEFARAGRAGEAVIVRDTARDSRANTEAYARLKLGAFVTIPFQQWGRWIANITVTSREPRDWQADEIELLQEIANRVFPRIERARAEASLRESEQRLSVIFAQAAVGLSEISLDGQFEQVNDALCQMLGRSRQELLAATVPTVTHPEDLPKSLAALAQLLETGEPVSLDKRYVRPDGTVLWANSILTRLDNEQGQAQHILAVTIDLSDRKQAEANEIQLIREQAARTEEHQRAESLAELDRAKTLFFSNISHEFRTPLTLILAPLEEALRNLEGDSGDGEERRDGGVQSSIASLPPASLPLLKENLQLAQRNSLRLLRLVNTLLDFSRIEAGRMEAVYEPTDLALLTTELASVFRSAIEREGLQLIVDCPPLPEPVFVDREMWEKIVLNLLSNAFNFTLQGEITVSLRVKLRAKIQDSTSTPHHLTSDLETSTSELEPSTLELETPTSELKALTSELKALTSGLEPSTCELKASTSGLEPSTCELKTSTSGLEPSTCELKASTSEFQRLNSELEASFLHPHVILQICDTGSGIAPEHLPHLFERFYQIRSTQARRQAGSGIGLALVHELVRLHGGTIEVRSILGAGTCFTIALPLGTEHLPGDRVVFPQEDCIQAGDRIHPIRTLPSTAIGATFYRSEAERWLLSEANREQTRRDPAEQTTPTADAQVSAIASARVLVVDDNADMREYLTRILSTQVQVEAVADGAAALAIAQERVPDLILSDVMMPELNGFELLAALRSHPRTKEIPIILLSARAGEEAIVEGLESGADDYLIKPFSAQALVSRVNAHLHMAQLRREALQEARTNIRRRDEMISTISHELNTPLVAILGWTRLLRSSLPSPALLSKALDTIERNATLQGKLIQDLLDISRITAGKLRLNLQPLELQPVLETAIATVTQTAAAKGVDLTLQTNVTEPVVVLGDSDRLSQVFTNLLTNAIKFTPEGGGVEMGVSWVVGHGSCVKTQPPGMNDQVPMTSNQAPMTHNQAPMTHNHYAEIRVTDTGIGISAEFLPHVFDRFRQATTVAKGLGLGLAIARHIVELHNGTIHADSAGEGQGATFTVRLSLFPTGNDCNRSVTD